MAGKVCLSRKNSVATDSPLASMAALDVLRRGGNAFDAAVAASFTLSVVIPEMNGPGGDFMALVYSADRNRVFCLNASGWAPSALTVEKLKEAGHSAVPFQGAFSVVVPGFVGGLHALHKRFGRLEFSDILLYPIALADDGFPVSRGLASSIARFGHLLPATASRILMPGGKGLRAGEILRQRPLANLLRALAQEGPDAFYRGWVADEIRREVERNGGVMNPEDLASFEPEWTESVTSRYRGRKVYEIPPNSMGATTLLLLKLLEGRDLERVKPNSSERIALTIPAVKEAYAQKDRLLGDPRFVSFDLRRFLSEGGSAPANQPGEGDTTYYAVSDADGNIVSCIESLFHQFGSNVFVNKCGFFLNNRGSSFKFDGPNRLEPRKRPLHSLSSILLEEDGEVKLATGSSAGDYRPQQHALLLTNIIDYSMSLEEAIDHPRFWWDGGEKVLIDKGFTGLSKLEYETRLVGPPRYMGSAQGVELLENSKKAVCDMRGDGVPVGD